MPGNRKLSESHTPKHESVPSPSPSGAKHPLAEHIGYVLRRAQLAVFQDFCKHTAGFGLRPPEYSVLVVLNEMPGLRLRQLSATLGIKPANCVIVIYKLEKRGLIAREKLPVSGRSIKLTLTAKGEALLRQVNKRVDAHRQGLRDRLGEEGVSQLLNLLNRLFEG
jgi:DNA-binding MarR family transcriptional regulator